MKQLSDDAIEALPIIKPFAISGDTRLSQGQFLAMKCVYENIDLVFNNRKTTVNPGCSGCIPTCLKIIANYLKMMGEFHEKPARKVEAKVERVEVVSSDKKYEVDGKLLTREEVNDGLRAKTNKQLSLMLTTRQLPLPDKINKDNLVEAILSRM